MAPSENMSRIFGGKWIDARTAAFRHGTKRGGTTGAIGLKIQGNMAFFDGHVEPLSMMPRRLIPTIGSPRGAFRFKL